MGLPVGCLVGSETATAHSGDSLPSFPHPSVFQVQATQALPYQGSSLPDLAGPALNPLPVLRVTKWKEAIPLYLQLSS